MFKQQGLVLNNQNRNKYEVKEFNKFLYVLLFVYIYFISNFLN